MGANRDGRQTLSFSGNGYYLASGSRDGVVKPGLPKGKMGGAGIGEFLTGKMRYFWTWHVKPKDLGESHCDLKWIWTNCTYKYELFQKNRYYK